jgi:hypothetical protein
VSDTERAWVWDHSPYSGNAKLIHLKMADWANEGHEWMLWCGDITLAEKASCTRRSVERTKAKMVEDGYLEDLHERHENGNLLYRFLMPGTDQCDILSKTNATFCPTNATSRPIAPITNQREPKSARSRRKPETSFPVGQFIITDEMLAWVAEKDFGYLDLRMETELFKDHALANDRRVRDWVAAWRTWIRRAARYNPKPDPTTDRSHIPIESWR